MIKKLFFWIIGVCLSLALAGYVLLFTPLGHSLFKPLLQSKLDSLSPIRLEITEFELTFTTLNLVLKNGEYIDITLSGDFWLPSQEFDLRLSALVRDMSIFGELVDTPLQGGFSLEAQASGRVDNFEIHAKSDIAKSFSTLYLRFVHRELQSLDIQTKEASLPELLAMLGHKPYIKGLLSIDSKFFARDSKLEGSTSAVVSHGAFDTHALNKDFDIALEDTAFSATLSAQSSDEAITHTFAFTSPIGTIHAQGRSLLPSSLTLPALRSLPTQGTFSLNLSNLSPFSPLVGRAIRGGLQSSGSIEGEGVRALEIRGESDLSGSQTRYAISLQDLRPLEITAHAQGAALERLLWMLHLPPYANATLDIHLQALGLDSVPTTTLSAQASGMLNTDIALKEFGIALPRTPLTLALSMVFERDEGRGVLSVDSKPLRLEAQPITTRAHTLHSPYALLLKDASKLLFASGIALNGALDLRGEFSFDKSPSLSFATQDLGGTLRGSYRDSQIKAQLDSVMSQKLLALFGIPQILQAPLSGSLSYNTLGAFGTLTLSGTEGKLAQSKLSSDAMRLLGVDMTSEMYHNIALSARIDETRLNAEFRLDSPRTHLSSQGARIDLRTRRINAPLALRIGESEANVWLTESLTNPNVRIEIKSLIIKSEEILKGLGKVLKF